MPHKEPETRKKYRNQYRKNNLDKILKQERKASTKYRKNHPDRSVASSRIYNATHQEIRKAYAKSYYQKNKEKIKAKKKEWELKNRELLRYKKKLARISDPNYRLKNRILCKAKYNRQKFKLFEILGGPICINCGFEEIRALQFDHINSDGRLERKNHKLEYLGNYIKNPELARQRLQVLCANCNWIKRHEKNENRVLFHLSGDVS